MAIEQYQTPFGTIGEGRERNNSPTGVPRDEESMSIGSSQETELASSLGTSQRNEESSNIILPERGDIDGDEMVVIREFIAILRNRLARVTRQASEATFLSDEWWEVINTIEAIGDTIQALRREFRRN